MRQCWQDLVYALRVLRKSPGYTVTATLIIAIAIGANVALFTAVKAVIINPLPFPEPSRLVALHESVPLFSASGGPLSTIEFNLLRGRVQSLTDMGAYESVSGELSDVASPTTISMAKVTSGLLEVLGAQPLLGRTFQSSEDVPDSNVAILSHGLWMRQFGGDPGVLNRTVTIDRAPRKVIGIMPPRFVFPMRGPVDNSEPADVLIPMALTPLERQGRGPILQKSVVARVRAGATLEQVQAELRTLVPSVVAGMPSPYSRLASKGIDFEVVSLQREVTGNLSRILWLLMAAVTNLLLIACANLANLGLTRAVARRPEYALRAAIGAKAFSILRLIIAENLVLATLGGFAGMVLATASTSLILNLSPIPIPRAEEIKVDMGVVLFGILAILVTAVLTGAAAFLYSLRIPNAEVLKEAGRGATASRSRQRTFTTLASAQFALTVILLVAAGLMTRSLSQTLKADPGFVPEHSVELTTHLPFTQYSKAAQVHQMYTSLANNAEQVSGMRFAGIGTELPLGNWEKGSISVEGGAPDSGPIASQVWVTGHFLEALGVPLKRGRFFADAEYTQARGVVVISQALADRLWPGLDPLGRRLRNTRTDLLTVVGVVGDVKEVALSGPAIPQIYEPHIQLPERLMEMPTIPFFRTAHLVSRSDLPSAVQIEQLTSVLHKADASLAVTRAQRLADTVSLSTRPQRLNTLLVTGFSSIALVLAVLGVFSVVSYSVAQRQGEIGIRIALGAQRDNIIGMVLRQGVRLAIYGIVAGLLGATVVSQLLRQYLFGVRQVDPLTFTVVPAMLGAVACLGCYWPARRAANVDPMTALRHQ